MSRAKLACGLSALLLATGLHSAALAEDTLRVAAGLAGTWENSFSELGQNAGFFKRHGIALDVFYTQGAGETQQAVISGSADVGTGVGAFNTFGAFMKGAPIRVIAATHTGADDLTWYVRADSPIKDKKDLAGKTVAYSTAGSSTYATVLAFQKVFGVSFTPVATGGPPSTLTQVMSGQIDVGWTSPPFALDLLAAGKTRASRSSFAIWRPTARWSIGCIPIRPRSRRLPTGLTFRKRWRKPCATITTPRKMSCPTASKASTRLWPMRCPSSTSPPRFRRISSRV